jgi:uncharacterized protein (TIGR02270 family)
LLAHLDGLRLARESAGPFFQAMRERTSAGALYVSTVRALEGRDDSALDELMALAQALPETQPGLLAAFGWVEPSRLQGTVVRLLASGDPFARTVGIAACALHRVDPGIAAGRLLEDPAPAVRARAFRTAGELGLRALVSTCAAASERDDDADVRFWAAWSAVLLGDREAALRGLAERARADAPHRARAFSLVLLAMSPSSAHAFLQQFGQRPDSLRWQVRGSGMAGDPKYVPWLIAQMGDTPAARLAGEAFALITGVDLGADALDRPAPGHVPSGPTDDPDDPNVEADPDDDLTWPDPQRVEAWWSASGSRFVPGARSFLGSPVTRAGCIGALRHGYQPQRLLGAHHLCLMDPGTPLFNTSAPARRQQRLLAQM